MVIFIKKKYRSAYEKKKKKMMIRKGKGWGKKEERYDEMLKVRIGGWKNKWRNSVPLV